MKLQTIFLLPFLIYLYFLRGDFSLLHFLIPLAMNIALPLLFGRGPFDTFRIYANQAMYALGDNPVINQMTVNSVSFWLFLTQDNILYKSAIVLTLSILGIALVGILRRPRYFRRADRLLWLLLWSSWTCTMFLPGMHDRYNYLVVILFFAASVIDARAVPFAIALELADMTLYSTIFEKGVKYSQVMWLAALGCAVAYFSLSAKLLRAIQKESPKGSL